ncbi:MAG: SH3 domain-containing C40 family peptidase [Tissierellia bacterium]|nr:SH3 domain-containing C40 family peptidase [Tissierellia bacterium]
MKKKVHVNGPVVPLYGGPEVGVLVDEILYGQWAEVLEESGEFLKIRTEYGYEGYGRASDFIATNGERSMAQMRLVQSTFADILSGPDYEHSHLITLPMGSRIALLEEGLWCRVQLLDGREGYTRRENLTPLPQLSENWREEVMSVARKFLGTQYRWGGKSALGIDCSGLVFLSYAMAGIYIYRDAVIKEGHPIVPVPEEEMLPGDLLYYPGHVTMYLGDGKMIHSSATNNGVAINSTIPGAPDFLEKYRDNLLAVGRLKLPGQ